jgi:hypothetical protein
MSNELLAVGIPTALIMGMIGMMWRAMTMRFEQVEKRFEQVDKRFEQVDKRFEQVDKRFNRLENKIDTLFTKHADVDKLVQFTLAGNGSSLGESVEKP